MVEYSRRYGCGHLRVAHECIGRIKNLMLKLIKIQRSSSLDLFRKVLREARQTVFGRQECVVGRKIYYNFILFVFNSSRDRVKDLAGSSRVFITSRDEEKSE